MPVQQSAAGRNPGTPSQSKEYPSGTQGTYETPSLTCLNVLNIIFTQHAAREWPSWLLYSPSKMGGCYYTTRLVVWLGFFPVTPEEGEEKSDVSWRLQTNFSALL